MATITINASICSRRGGWRAAPHHPAREPSCSYLLLSDSDRELYLELLAEHCERYQVDLMGYCLMTNHVHLIAVPGRADSLARGIGRAHHAFSRWMNIRRHQTGHFFQARFDSSPTDRPYTWRALLYTELNPVRAGMVHRTVDYRWSSARVHGGLIPCPPWLTLHPWAEAYWTVEWAEILEAGFREHGQLERLREGLRSGRPLGDAAFVDDLEAKLGRTLRPQKSGRPPKEQSACKRDGANAEGKLEESKEPRAATVRIPWDDPPKLGNALTVTLASNCRQLPTHPAGSRRWRTLLCAPSSSRASPVVTGSSPPKPDSPQ